MQKSTIISIIVSIVILGGTSYFVFGRSPVYSTQNVEIKEGVQYVTIIARGGYSPRVSVIQPNIPTKLIVKTNRTYDCSAFLTIRELDFQKRLQPTGEEVIDLGVLEKGDKIQGVCRMGMNSFQIKVS